MAVRDRRDAALTTHNWPIKPSQGGAYGLAASAGALIVGFMVLVWAVQQPLGAAMMAGLIFSVLAIALAAALAVAALGFFHLRYELAEGELLIHSGGPTVSVPLEDIDGIYAGARVGRLGPVQGINWPGYYVGMMRTRSLGALGVYCTDREVSSLSVVVTPRRTLVLSPVDPPSFRRELIRRIEGGQISRNIAAMQRRPLLSYPNPFLAALVAVAVTLLLASLGVILANYQALSEMLPLQLDRGAVPSPRTALFDLPLLGAGVLVLNVGLAVALRWRERAAPTLLCGTAALAQAVILLATLRLLP